MAAQDFRKLELLGPPQVSYAAVLLIGFDAENRPMDTEVEQLARTNALADRGWVACRPQGWPDRNCPWCRTVCYSWWHDCRARTPTPTTRPNPTVTERLAPDPAVLASLRRAQEDPEALRRNAARVFRKYLELERRAKRAGGDSVNSWSWEQAVSEILGMAQSDAAVGQIASELRAKERPYKLEGYDDSWRFDRLLDHFEESFTDNT